MARNFLCQLARASCVYAPHCFCNHHRQPAIQATTRSPPQTTSTVVIESLKTIIRSASALMPVNSVPSATSPLTTTFDPNDEHSWFFGFMSRADATELLSNSSEIGAFLVRESTTAKGDLVLSVKVSNDKVSHYIINKIASDKGQQVCFRIGEQVFLDMPTLLTFYKLNNLDDTALKVPAIPKDPSVHKRSFTKDYLAEIYSDNNSKTNCSEHKIGPSSLQRKLPGLAKVVQSRIPNAYDKTALTLKEGDIVRVTKTDISGCWEGEISGRKGHFPFNYVKFIEDMNE